MNSSVFHLCKSVALKCLARKKAWKKRQKWREHYETISRGFSFSESVRSKGRAPRRSRAASSHHSFSDCALYRKRRLLGIGHLGLCTESRIGRLLPYTRDRALPTPG